MSTPIAEYDCRGLTELPSMETSDKGNENGLNLKATELRLGLPGSESPDRLERGFLSLKSCYAVSGAKRGFSAAINGPGKWVFSSGPAGNGLVGSDSGPSSSGLNNGKVTQLVKSDGPTQEKKGPGAHGATSASKEQVVGWPPIRSFRKNTMVSQSQKSDDESEAKSGSGCLFVKVSMEGAPYLRKIDLKSYKSYRELSAALEKMFGCFTIGHCGSHGVANRGGLDESRLADLLHGSECVLTYEDKDGDWMLVGDVPWKMFTDTCKKLRIMKSSEAIGQSARVVEKCKSRN